MTFYDELTGAITDLFNGTILEDPALDLVYCLLGSKLTSLEEALTYLNAHLHLTIPAVSPDVLMLSSNSTSEFTASLTSSNSTLSSTGVVDKMVASYARTLASQRLGFILCISIWGVVLLMGLVGLWWRVREERRASAHVDGLKPFALGAGAAGGGAGGPGVFELWTIGDEKRSLIHQPLPSPTSPAHNPARNTLAAYLSRLSGVFGEAMGGNNNRRATGTTFGARSDVGGASPSPRAMHSFATLRSRVPRPTPAFRAARDVLTSVLPSKHEASTASPPLAKQTWDPPTSPQAQGASVIKPRVPDWLTLSSPPATTTVTRKRVPSTASTTGWQSLPSPTPFQHSMPPSPPYQRHSVGVGHNPFADSQTALDMGTSGASRSLLPAYYHLPERGHLFANVSAIGTPATAVDPFATPFDGEGER